MVASVAYITAYYVVGVIRFRYQITGVYTDLKGRKQCVVSWLVTLHSKGHTRMIFILEGRGRGRKEGKKQNKTTCLSLSPYLQNVVSRFHICDINPLAIYVSIVSVITARTQSLKNGVREVSKSL